MREGRRGVALAVGVAREGRRGVALASLAVVLVLAGSAPPALAAPPNDAPQGAAAFQTVTAANGTPTEREATAVLADATADPGVRRCLGPESFSRTVWLRVESAATARRVKVEASGDTTQSPDLAAFVQPPGATDRAPAVAEPQACDGPGGAIAAAGEGTSVVDLHVPAGHQVLLQVGRNAAQAPASVLLALDATALPDQPAPAGDRAGDAPAVALGSVAGVTLAGATLTEEDPAEPACPAAASVWRRVDIPGGGAVRAVARGAGVGTLTAFSGAAPSGDGVLDCANRARGDAVELTVRARAGEPLWLRVGADSHSAEPATLRVERAPAGGAQPGGTGTAGGGAGGGAASGCTDRTRPTVRLAGGSRATAKLRLAAGSRAAAEPRLAAGPRATAEPRLAAGPRATAKPRLSGTAADRGCGANVRRVEVALQRRSGTRCQAVGLGGRPGRRRACARLTWVRATGTARWSLTLRRALPAGRYVLRVRARDHAGNASTITRTTFTVTRKSK